jgi:hypothetical protein
MCSRYSHHYVNIDDLKYYCFWCPRVKQQSPTYIEFDLELHIFEAHRMAMVKLPIGKGNMERRVSYAVNQCKQMTQQLRRHPEKWNELFSNATITTIAAIGGGVIEEESEPEPEIKELIEEPYEVGEVV